MELYDLPRGVRTLWASPENPHAAKGGAGLAAHGRKGMSHIYIRSGECFTLARAENTAGVVRRMWFTVHDFHPMMLKQLRLEMFWDGCKTPAVSVPFGDFFCMNLGRMKRFDSELFASPEGRSFNCFIPMPFRTGMKITLTNDGASMAKMLYYDIDFTVGDNLPPDVPYFHAWYNQELPTTLLRDYTVLARVAGRGRFLGASFGVRMDKETYGASWGGEGEVKIYLDGDIDNPTLCGTGTEDYIGTGWCQGEYQNRYQGCLVADEADMLLGFYRFHVPDPVYFAEDIRVTIQQIGSWNPGLLAKFKADGTNVPRAGIFTASPPECIDPGDPMLPSFDLFERADFWCSCAYFYLDRAESGLPPLSALPERARAIPGFKEEDLTDRGNDMEQMKLLRQYIPDVDNLPLERLAELSGTLAAVVQVMSLQAKAYAGMDGEPKREDAK